MPEAAISRDRSPRDIDKGDERAAGDKQAHQEQIAQRAKRLEAGRRRDVQVLPGRQQGHSQHQQGEQPQRRLEQSHNDEGNEDDRGQDALHDRCPLSPPISPPKRRSRFWNASIASSNCAPRKSGQRVSVT